MLDGLAALLSLWTVLAYRQYKKRERLGWLIASAFLLGLAADTKFLHGTVGFAILLDWLYTRREAIRDRLERARILRSILLWGLAAVAIFFAANPYLWPNPVARLQETLAAISYTTTSPNVVNAAFPAWQPLTFLSMSVPYEQNFAFLLLADTFIFFLAIAGFGQMWKKESAFGFWLVLELIVLLVWRTKWPQYLLVVTAPLALAAAEGVNVLWGAISKSWKARRVTPLNAHVRDDTRRALPWLVPGLAAFTILTLLPLVFQFGMSMTDFSATSIRDGFNGGLWRAIWGGLTGQIPVSNFDMGALSNKVNFTGLGLYPTVFDLITRNPRWSVLFFNVMWTSLSVGLQVGLGLATALLLWQKGVRLGKLWQALFILPWAIPEYIGALMWFNIFQREWGWLYLAAARYGSDSIVTSFVNVLESNPSLWLVSYLLPAMWYGFPFMMLAASVGLKAIPREVLDAAAIDGANTVQSFRFVVWPLLLPMLVPALIVRGIFAFNQFYLFQAFFFGDATLATLSYNVFNPNSGFGQQGGLFSASAVINIIAVIILMAFVLAFNRWSKAGEGVTYA
jgi:ABC-type sugar transport system permease subunit